MKDSRGLLIIHLHVDDAMVFSDSDQLLLDFETFIDHHYDPKWTGHPTLYLGIKIDISSDMESIKTSQPQYIEMVLEWYCLVNCNTAKFPAHPTHLSGFRHVRWSWSYKVYPLTAACRVSTMDCVFHSTCIYAVTQLSRFNSAWTLHHWAAAKHVLRYLKGTSMLGIV